MMTTSTCSNGDRVGPHLPGEQLRRDLVLGRVIQLTNRKSYGHADSLDEAKAAFRAEYERWLAEPRDTPC
jgi:hypothetical protein